MADSPGGWMVLRVLCMPNYKLLTPLKWQLIVVFRSQISMSDKKLPY